MSDSRFASDRFIVDTSEADPTVLDYLTKWCALSRTERLRKIQDRLEAGAKEEKRRNPHR